MRGLEKRLIKRRVAAGTSVCGKRSASSFRRSTILPRATIRGKDGRLHHYVQANIMTFKMNAPVRSVLVECVTASSFPRGPTGAPRHRGQTLPIRWSSTSHSAINRYSQEKTKMRRARFSCFRLRPDAFRKGKKDMLLQSHLAST